MGAPVIERRVVAVFLVDREGRILMQHRSPHAKISPNQWTLPGGLVEEGEAPLEAGRREVYEETGIVVERLDAFWAGTRPSVTDPTAVVEIHTFCAATDARPQDLVLGEGQALLFLPADEALARDLGVNAAIVLPLFVASPEYAMLRA